jgi:hypothetical protein
MNVIEIKVDKSKCSNIKFKQQESVKGSNLQKDNQVVYLFT